MKEIFGDHDYSVHQGGTHSRRVSPPGSKQGWQTPLGFHVDAAFHGFEFTANFWTPFQDCGLIAPSLAVVAMSFAKLLTYLDFDGEPEQYRGEGEYCMHQFNPILKAAHAGDQAANEQIRDDVADALWTPQFAVGDVMLSSNWTLHSTHSTTSMTESRDGMELRLSGKAFLNDILAEHGEPIYQPKLSAETNHNQEKNLVEDFFNKLKLFRGIAT